MSYLRSILSKNKRKFILVGLFLGMIICVGNSTIKADWSGNASNTYTYGSIGIGTSDPFSQLEIKGPNPVITMHNSATNYDGRLYLGNFEGGFRIHSYGFGGSLLSVVRGTYGEVPAFTIKNNGDAIIEKTLTLGNDDTSGEGAQINWTGSSTNPTWHQDIYQNSMRFWSDNLGQGDNFILYSDGNAFVKGTITAQNYACSSDGRFKKDVAPIENSLAKILALKGVSYHWKKDEFKSRGFDDRMQIGFIAQDMEKVLPELVYTGNDGYKAVSYDKLTAVLVEALKDLKIKNEKEIAELKKENESLKAKINTYDDLSKRVAMLERNNNIVKK